MSKFEELHQEALAKIHEAQNSKDLNDLRVYYLGKKGPVQSLMKNMKDLPKEEKPLFGKKVNELKQKLSVLIDEKREELAEQEMQAKIESEKIDITLPGPDITDDEYCFERANIPKDHPARAMQDSLYIDENRLLRTHTTAIQMDVLEKSAPNLPIKVVCPGKVYRRDDDDATHSHQFMQMEGLVVGYFVGFKRNARILS